MAKQPKNLTIPFNCRKTYGRLQYNSVGSLKLDALPGIAGLRKEAQLLCCYNLKSRKYIDKSTKRFKCEFTNKSSAQTVIVLDFDGIGGDYPAEILKETIYDEMKTKPIVVHSPSGYLHAIIVVNATMSDVVFRRVVELLADKLPSFLREKLDPVSFNRCRYWYHSQHFYRWIDEGILNITKKEQGTNGFFFNDEVSVSYGKFFSFIANSVGDLSEKKEGQLCTLTAMAVRALIGSDVYGVSVQQDATQFLCGIVAEARRRGNPRAILSAIGNGKKTIQHAASGHLFESQLVATVREIEGLCGLDAEMADRNLGRGSEGSSGTDRGSPEEADLLCSAGDPQESSGNCPGGIGGHAESSERGFFDDFSMERLLALVSEFEVLLGRQQLDLDRMGHVISKDSFREHEHGCDEPEKQNHLVFDGMCRQVLEKYAGKRGVDASSYVRLYEWLRYAIRHLGNRNHDRRGVCKSADKIARGIRLSDAILGTRRFQALKERAANRFEHSNSSHIEEFAESLFEVGWQERVGNPKYAARVESFCRLHRERFLLGLRRMFGWLGSMRRKLAATGLDVGMEHFEMWFGSRELASYFRKLILEKVAATDHNYGRNVKTKTWWFYKAFKEKWLPRFEAAWGRSEDLSEKVFAARLGHGQTHERLRRGVVHVFLKMKGDVGRAAGFLHLALEFSQANDKRKRHQEIDRYLLKLHRWYTHGKLRKSA